MWLEIRENMLRYYSLPGTVILLVSFNAYGNEFIKIDEISTARKAGRIFVPLCNASKNVMKSSLWWFGKWLKKIIGLGFSALYSIHSVYCYVMFLVLLLVMICFLLRVTFSHTCLLFLLPILRKQLLAMYM